MHAHDVPDTPHFTWGFLQSQLPEFGHPELAQQISLVELVSHA